MSVYVIVLQVISQVMCGSTEFRLNTYQLREGFHHYPIANMSKSSEIWVTFNALYIWWFQHKLQHYLAAETFAL